MAEHGLVNERQFVAATRDSGYRCTAAAVAELVDNALQARAKKVAIDVQEEREEAERKITLAVADDGSGMTRDQLREALQWAGSSRFNDRSGLGRFGMGLPNSSASQARRVDVYTWRKKGQTLHSYLDLDDILDGSLTTVPEPRRKRNPHNGVDSARSGTVVVWSKCDRLDCKKASTLRRRLREALGRVFRRPIWDGVEISVNGVPVTATDPLFLRLEADDEAVSAQEPVPPLRFPIRLADGTTSEVVARFALLPIEEWHSLDLKEKRTLGITGGGGVSVLRTGREIANGWFFMDGKRRQNYDDWWRVELEFDPPLDELMGVTHSKQGIRPTPEINQILAPEIGAVARDLSTRVRKEFVRLAKSKSDAALRADNREWRLPRVRAAAGETKRRMQHLQYEIAFADSPDLEFFSWTRSGSELNLRINENHPFYRALYRPVTEEGLDWVRKQIDLLLLAFARAELSTECGGEGPLRTQWSDVVATFLGD